MTIRIRRMTLKDIDAIFAIERVSFSDPWSKRAFMSELVERGFNFSIVAEAPKGRKVIGYCLFWIIEDDETHITNIAINPEFRRQGIGKLLIDEVIQRSRDKGIPSVTLEVRESNTAAREFYDRLGFAEAGRRKGYYRKPVEDAIILRMMFEEDSSE
jgi:ribosomal-protein-alanine N-acetyltransferase